MGGAPKFVQEQRMGHIMAAINAQETHQEQYHAKTQFPAQVRKIYNTRVRARAPPVTNFSKLTVSSFAPIGSYMTISII